MLIEIEIYHLTIPNKIKTKDLGKTLWMDVKTITWNVYREIYNGEIWLKIS